jgi:hypothetical protein
LDNTVKTERQKYVDKLQGEITKAVNAQFFVQSTEGTYVLDWFKQLTSDLVNQLTNKRLEQEDYIEKRAQISLLRKIVQVLETQSNEQILLQLSEQLQLAETGE